MTSLLLVSVWTRTAERWRNFSRIRRRFCSLESTIFSRGKRSQKVEFSMQQAIVQKILVDVQDYCLILLCIFSSPAPVIFPPFFVMIVTLKVLRGLLNTESLRWVFKRTSSYWESQVGCKNTPPYHPPKEGRGDLEPARSWTWNLLIRSQMRYPLRHWPYRCGCSLNHH